jgi:DNA-binding response OmpR family regulator
LHILIVEDQERVADFLQRGLKAERHVVTAVRDGETALELLLGGGIFDVVILDLMLPGIHGLEVCQTARAQGVDTPILMLTALDTLDDKVKGLRLGADDYLTKPFEFEELLARLEVLGRRGSSRAPASTRLEAGDLAFDRDLLQVTRAGQEIKLTAKELAILELMMAAPRRVFSRERIFSSVWGLSEDPLTNVVEVYIARLRKKLDIEGRPPLIETLRGQGYRLVPEDETGGRASD